MQLQTPQAFGVGAPGGSAADHSDPAGQLGLLVGVLRRQARLIGLVALVGTALALSAGLRSPTLYTTKALVAIERPPPTIPGSGAPIEPLDPAAVREEMQVLNSYEQARLVVEDMGLAADSEFQPQPPSLAVRLRTAVARWLAGLVPAAPHGDQDPTPAASVSPAEEAAIRLFRTRMVALQEEDSRVIAVSFTSSSPGKAARIANRTVELFLRHEAEAKRAEAAKAAEWLSDRLEGLQADVERDEAAIQAYRSRFNLPPTGSTDVVDQQVADINRELVAARGDLAQRQASLAFAREVGGGQGREGLPEVMGSSVIAELRRQEGELLRMETELRLTYGEKHPRLQQVHADRADLESKIRQEVDRIVSSLQDEVATSQARVATLQQELDGVLGARNRNREAQLQLAELERKAAASQHLYELFLQQSKETEESAAIAVPGGRVLARAAVPDSPSTPGLTMFAIFGIISSTMAGGILGLLRDRLDDRLRDAQQVRASAGLPCIAMIPRLERRDKLPVRQAGRLDAYVEAMRSVLAAMHLRGDGHRRGWCS